MRKENWLAKALLMECKGRAYEVGKTDKLSDFQTICEILEKFNLTVTKVPTDQVR